MKQPVLRKAEKYARAHRRKKLWYRVVTCLAAAVVFCTVYALVLPAITMEKQCSIPEHTHSDDCYAQVTFVTKKVPVCSEESLELHRHTESCYDGEGRLICGYADFVVHHHDSSCYDENGALWCPLPEIEPHTHTESCLQSAESGAEPACGKTEIVLHGHTAECFDENGTLICGKLQILAHQHAESCFAAEEEPVDPTVLTCTETDPEHVHIPRCYGTWELTCGIEEHVHGEACQTAVETASDGEAERVEELIARIDALPSSEEIKERLTALDDAGDEDRYLACYEEIYHQVMEAYLLYLDVGSDGQQQVTNREKLLALKWMYSARTMAITESVTVQQVNCFGSASGGVDKVILIYNASGTAQTAGSIVSNLYQFPSATAITVENRNGTLVVAETDTATEDKGTKSIPANGFMIIIPTGGSVSVSAGDYAAADFDYTKQAFNTGGLGTVTFSSTASFSPKPEKDNSSKLTIVPGADTRELIEVNLYDYGTNINDLYNSNNKYPGFQQEGGSTSVGDSFSKWMSFNFGNNITADLAAGKANVTVAGGTGINATANGANSPISGAMQPVLGSDGYPALKDGTSLGYLFSNSKYAVRKNSESINGLFRYNETTDAYTFNSRENHAQFNAEDNTFTLYDQILSSNFMMYPFGNFLPFNDIVHLSAQTTVIDRAYLSTIAESAQYKYNNGAGKEYGTLGTQLKQFIKLMDAAYPGGWTGVDCMNEYFKASGIPRTFSSDEELVQKLYSIDYDEPTDFYFGMEMKMNFMQPKGGLTGKDGRQPMVFYFTGDDDVWVYIDGVLFLDLSGIHRHVGGEIDFVNGVVKYYTLDVSTGDVGTEPYQTVKFSDLVSTGLNEKGTFADYSKHTFNFYYMERGSGSGVCRMNFNFPLLHKNTISVTKELSVDEPDKLPLLGDPDFRFQVMKENGTDPFIGAGVSYDVLDAAGNRIGSGETDQNGVFTLKAGQTAVFSGIPENAGQYFVRELLDPDAFGQYGTISVDGSSQTVNYEVTVGEDQFKGVNSPLKDMSSGNTSFHFNNQVTFNKLGSLSVEKKLTADYSGIQPAQQFEFLVTLDGSPLPAGTEYTVGTETRTVQQEGILLLSPGETALVRHILAGSAFTVREQAVSGYVASYELDGTAQPGDSVSGVIQTEHTAAVLVNNSEQGTAVQIPVQKTLNAPDGLEHSYTLLLEQVNSPTDLTATEPEFNRELPVTITEGTVDARFEIGYAQNRLGELPQTFYYKISEAENPDEKRTRFDSSVYVAEVTVTDQDGVLSAEVTRVWKDQEELTGSVISFTNEIVRYELPKTGGAGTEPYIIRGLLLIAAAGLLLFYKHSKRRREERLSS